MTLATNGLQAGIGLATGVATARILGVAGKGELATIQSIGTIIVTLGTLGLYEAVVYYAAREPETGGKDSTAATAFLLAASIVFFPLALWAVPRLLPGQRPEVQLGAQHYLFIYPAFVLMGAVQSILRASGRLLQWNVVRVAIQLSWLAIIIVGSTRAEVRPEELTTTYMVVLIVLAVVLTVFYREIWVAGWPPEARRLPRLFRYGLPLFAKTGSRALNVRLDVVVMAAVLTSDDVGVYAVAATWSTVLGLLPTALNAVLVPRLASEADPARRQHLERQSLVAGGAAIVGAAIVLGFAAPVGIPLLFGGAFASAVPYAVGLLAAGAVLASSQLMGALVQSRGKTDVLLFAELVGLAATGVGLVTLLPRYGIWGAVITSTLAYASAAALIAASLLRRRSPPPPPPEATSPT
ncbi:MAG: lipopolysaccharide biosynthesis protein [Myxococcota bacterium]